jgi:hypothetical protein
MKTQIGVGVAVLSALAAEGKDFDRAELNAMLDKLAASPEPKVRRGASAMCYSISMARPEPLEYVCEKCGTHTVYPENVNQMANTLARYRDEAAKLKALGLDIALDESVLCQKCKSAKDIGLPEELGAPTGGTIVGRPKEEAAAKEFGWKIGDRVEIIHCYDTSDIYYVWPTPRDCWISAKYVSETGEIFGDSVNVRIAPRIDAKVVWLVSKSDKPVRRLPAKTGDPAEWVRIEARKEWFQISEETTGRHSFPVPKELLGDLSHGSGPSSNPARIDKLAWVINGKRTIVRTYDARILKAFLTGKTIWEREFDEEVSVKNALPRIRELLGVKNGK